jgi:hypothetical protein
MKSTILFMLPVAALAAILDVRQLGGGNANVAAVEKLTPRFRSTAQRTLTKFGRESNMDFVIKSLTP